MIQINIITAPFYTGNKVLHGIKHQHTVHISTKYIKFTQYDGLNIKNQPVKVPALNT